VGQHHGFVRFAVSFSLLDTGLMELLAIRLSWQTTPAKSLVIRRYDGLINYLGLKQDDRDMSRIPFNSVQPRAGNLRSTHF
jgi:hypothetical protein